MHVFVLTIDHQYSSWTFLPITVQTKVVGVKLFQNVQGNSIRNVGNDWKMLSFNTSLRLVDPAFLTIYISHLIKSIFCLYKLHMATLICN